MALQLLTTKRPKQVAVSTAAPAQVRSKTSSDADKVPLDTLANTVGERIKLVKPKPAVEENSISKELPLVVRKESEQPAQQSNASGSGMLHEAVDKHQADFDTAAPSANYDHICIRFLEKELKEIIKQHRSQRFQADLTLLVLESSATGYFYDDIPLITWTEARIVSKQGTNATAPETEEKSAQAERQRVLAIENQTQSKLAQEEETSMIEQQA
ncbi:hypothetical protein F511_32980 [Dorcoceras hygrometricum]|uniref:Uncharacterized protein n=1 Tax=Dorcoceras hygrometricum TaxID=472368 RepID=A0A2Z7BIX9_9LAMI|nr:hypothetical protein F511_32980 [Dorcoceras hygrometricum]